MTKLSFTERLRRALDMSGLEQHELAKNAGTTQATISRYLKAQTEPAIFIVVRIANALNVSVDYLCGLTDAPTPRESMDADKLMLLECYGRTTIRDRKLIWEVLSDYMEEDEKKSLLADI